MIPSITTWTQRRCARWSMVLAALWLSACSAEKPGGVFQRGASRFEPAGTAQRAPASAATPLDATRPRRKTNIHYSAQYCLECHETTGIDKKTKSLKYNGDFKKLCLGCHDERQPIHAHPSKIAPDASSGVKIPDGFPLQQGELGCLTCHDVFLQCRDSEADKLLMAGQMLLRGMPYKNRLSFCFRCHDESRYPRYNPHEQLDAAGQVMAQKCLYCHTDVPDATHVTYREVKLIDGYGELCKGCHYLTAKQPFHLRHLRKPVREVAERMQQVQAQFEIVLPLDPNGSVTCVTCHNPHQKGLIPDQRAGAKGAGTSHRQRLPGNLCIKCHTMR